MRPFARECRAGLALRPRWNPCAAEELGATLAERGHTILVGSEDPNDIDVILQLFGRSSHTTFDLERKVLMFSNLSVK